MLCSSKSTIQDDIVLFFIKNPGNTLQDFLHVDSRYSLQYLYRQVNVLVKGGVLVKEKTRIFVNKEWLVKLQHILPSQSALSISPGESVRWKFTSAEHFDAFWKHIVFQLLEEIPDCPVFGNSPHNFWLHAPNRFESEKNLYEYFPRQSRHLYFSTNESTSNDKEDRNLYPKSSFVHHDNSSKSLPVGHLIIIGPYIGLAKLKPSQEKQIDSIYKENKNRMVFLQKIKPCIEQVQRVSFSVEHNHKKAQKLRKKISKNFYVPLELISKFDLW